MFRVISVLLIVLSFLQHADAQRGRGERPPASVFVTEVEMRSFATRVEALGTLEPRERVELSLNVADRVRGVFFEDGQRVVKGQTLLSLAQREQVANVEAAEAVVAEARAELDRFRRLREQDAIAPSALEEAQRNFDNAIANLRAVQSRQKDRILVAPFDGVLGFRQVSVGAFLRPGDPVATLIDDSEMRLEFAVPSIFLTQVQIGAEVVARTDDLPGTTFTGTVTSLDNAIDPVTRSFLVRATLPNPERFLRAGMFMTVDLIANPVENLAVPEGALQPRGPLNFVFVASPEEGNLVARRREVTVGRRDNGMVEMIDGLEAGEQVITQGLIRIREGGKVKIEDASVLDPSKRGSSAPVATSSASAAPGP